jgi:hypothetical protein
VTVRKGNKPMKLLSSSPRPARVSGWVEEELAASVKVEAARLGIKPSPALRRWLILGMVADGIDIESDLDQNGSSNAQIYEGENPLDL